MRNGRVIPVEAIDFAEKSALFLPREAQYDYLVNLPEDISAANLTDRNGDQITSLGAAVNNAMSMVEDQSEQLKGVLPKEYTIFSDIVKWMMEKSGRTIADIAEALNCTTSYLNNKLHLDSFSLDDLIIVAYICGYTMTFTSNNPDAKERSIFQIDVQKYFGSSNVEALKRLYEYERRLKDRKKAEYDELKAKLEQMKTEYGFED